jgi:hypothetical protein
MSALPPKRSFAHAIRMSALGQKATSPAAYSITSLVRKKNGIDWSLEDRVSTS